MALPDLAEDLVDGRVGGQGAVEDVELAFETLRDVITTTARLDHGGQVLQREERGMDAMRSGNREGTGREVGTGSGGADRKRGHRLVQ